MKHLRRLLDLIPVFAFCLLMVNLSYHILTSVTKPTELIRVRKGSEDITASVTGYIFKNENMISAEGDVTLDIKSGERVHVGQVIGHVQSDGEETEITSPCAGYFYADVDGLEEIFSADAVAEMSFTYFNMLMQSRTIDTSKCIGKISTDFNWYFAYTVTDSEHYTVGESYMFDFDGTRMEMELLRSDIGRTGTLLVFKTSVVPKDFDFTRIKSPTVTLCTYSGYIVPSNAVKEIDKSKYIYVFDGGVLRRTEVRVLCECDGIAVIDCDMDIGEETVAVGGKLYDGKVMK